MPVAPPGACYRGAVLPAILPGVRRRWGALAIITFSACAAHAPLDSGTSDLDAGVDGGSLSLGNDAGATDDGGTDGGSSDGGSADAGQADGGLAPISVCSQFPGAQVVRPTQSSQPVIVRADGTGKGHLVVLFRTPGVASTSSGSVGSSSPVHTNWLYGRANLSRTACDFEGRYALSLSQVGALNTFRYQVTSTDGKCHREAPATEYAVNVEFDEIPTVVVCGAQGDCNWFVGHRPAR